jgi:hypothetical protein
VLYNKETPFTGDTLQGMHTAINEAQTGAGYQVFDCTGDEDLAWASLAHHARPDMHGNPTDLVVHHFTLASM